MLPAYTSTHRVAPGGAGDSVRMLAAALAANAHRGLGATASLRQARAPPSERHTHRLGAIAAQRADHAGGVAHDHHAVLHVGRHDRACADHGPLAVRDTRQDDRTRADGGPPLHQGGFQGPVGLALRTSVVPGRRRVPVVQEVDVVAHEYSVLDRDPFANERGALNLAAGPDLHALLNLHARAGRRLVPDLAPVQIDERMHPDVFPQLHVGRDPPRERVPFLGGERGHQGLFDAAAPFTGITTPPWSIERCAASRIRTTRAPARPSTMSEPLPRIACTTLSASTA